MFFLITLHNLLDPLVWCVEILQADEMLWSHSISQVVHSSLVGNGWNNMLLFPEGLYRVPPPWPNIEIGGPDPRRY
jgi:hypothetical protein